LHEVIFPESWAEEKSRNKRRRDKAASVREHKFVESLSKVSRQRYVSINLTKDAQNKRKSYESPVVFDAPKHKVEVSANHPLTEPIFKSKKHAQLVSQIMVAFERANKEHNEVKRRTLFYRLLQDIFAS
jgi:CRISPR/Cas system endoribonuclease Cas6 (RAMP superfamily)